jgi:hypothetical protein
VYRVPLASERYGVAIGCRTTTLSTVTVLQQTAADGLEVRQRTCRARSLALDVIIRNSPPDSPTTISTSGSFTGRMGDMTATMPMDPGLTEVFVTASPTATFRGQVVRIPTFDLEVNQAVTADFAAQGVTLESHPLSVVTAAGETASLSTAVITRTGSYFLGPTPLPATSPMFQILPASSRQPDDLFSVSVTATMAGATTVSRFETLRSKVPQTLMFELPPALVAAPPELLTVPFLHPAFSFASTAGTLPIQTYGMNTTTTRTTDNVTHFWTVTLTSSWIGSTGSVQYVFPDLSAIAGFSADYILFDRTKLNWTWQHSERTTGTGDGSMVRTTFVSGTAGSYCGNGIVEPPETCDPPVASTCSPTCTML